MKKSNILALLLGVTMLFSGCAGTVLSPVDSMPETSEPVSSAPEVSVPESEASSSLPLQPSEPDTPSPPEQSEEVSSQPESLPEEKPEEYQQAAVNNRMPYCIKINRALNTATVYQKDGDGEFTDPVKAIVVSCGGANTPLGTFRIGTQYRWLLMVDDVYSQYASRVVGHILIHSVPYYTQSPDDLCYNQYNRLGTTASHGCIRMTTEDAKWVMDHCKSGTTVVIYDNYNKSGPLGKPTAQKIPVNSKNRGWDPTDPDSRNPWNRQEPAGAPEINGAKDCTVELGGTFDPLAGITAAEAGGKNINDRITVEGKADTNIVGSYPVTYRVTDTNGQKASVSITVTVADTTPPSVQFTGTDLFAAGSEEAGCAEIRQRVSVTDASQLTKQDVSLTRLDVMKRETVLSPTDEQGNPLGIQILRTEEEYSYEVAVHAADAYGNVTKQKDVYRFLVATEVPYQIE